MEPKHNKQCHVNAKLDMQLQYRNQGVPTLSVLSGTFNDTKNIWLQWMKGIARNTAICPTGTSKLLFTNWLQKLFANSTLRDEVLTYLAKLHQCPKKQLEVELINKSDYELDIMQQQSQYKRVTVDCALILRWFIKQIAANNILTVGSAVDLIYFLEVQKGQHISTIISVFAEILPLDIIPGLLIEVSTDDLYHSDLVHLIIQIAESHPGILLALSIQPATLTEYLSKHTESKDKVMLRTGVVVIPQIKTSGLPIETNKFLYQCNMPQNLLDDAHALQQVITDKNVDHSVARSQAELFLFNVLMQTADTKNLFKLNAKLPFEFGNQAMEVDLFASTVQVAIEIDGYYHFQDLDAWRRDRRKDFELQTKEILVLRFLSEDVLSKLEEILYRIRQALHYQRRKLNGRRVSYED